ncbi:MAG: NUDIX domain-containing protein [Imperialibacter sp.]|uniref:NUDIX domain-containing protein n=1 Tax=Imperialibacter sp. TaxID=2038411 RepID=UPI003A865C54
MWYRRTTFNLTCFPQLGKPQRINADSPEECIRRETKEETGYKISKPEKVFELYMSPGSVTEILYFFIAAYTKDQKVSDGGGVDEQEYIDVLEVPFAKALEMIKAGEIKDAKTVILLQHLQLSGRLNWSRNYQISAPEPHRALHYRRGLQPTPTNAAGSFGDIFAFPSKKDDKTGSADSQIDL